MSTKITTTLHLILLITLHYTANYRKICYTLEGAIESDRCGGTLCEQNLLKRVKSVDGHR